MRQEEIDARDFNGEGEEPINPVVETESGDIATRRTFKDGTTDWTVEGRFDNCVHQEAMEDAYSMGIAANEKEHPFRRPDEPVIDAYQKGKEDGRNEGYVEGYQDAWEKALATLRAEVDKMIASHKGEHGND